jgi:hypothetical protein
MNQTQAAPLSVGVTVMPEWFQSEGVDAVLDRLHGLELVEPSAVAGTIFRKPVALRVRWSTSAG